MRLSALEQELLKLQKLNRHQINLLQNGVRPVGVSGKQIDDLLREASAARFQLARWFLRAPNNSRRTSPFSIGTRYRGLTTLSIMRPEQLRSSHPGDDYERHDKVANGLPLDLPDVELWRNKIKDARLKRNEADYEPFMNSNPSFRLASAAITKAATEFLAVCSTYLRGKGCRA